MKKTKAQLIAELEDTRKELRGLRAACAPAQMDNLTSSLHSIFTYANDAIFLNDFETRTVIDANEVACKRLGYTREELQGMPLANFNSPETMRRAADTILKQLAEEGKGVFETRHICKDGSSFPVEVSSRVLDFEDRRCMLSIARDISDRQSIQEDLEQSRSRTAAILSAMTAHIMVLDREHNILWANDLAKSAFGANLEGHPCPQFYCNQGLGVDKCLVAKVFESGKIHEMETRVPEPNGQQTDFWCIASVAERTPEGEPLTVAQVCRDITARKDMERELLRSETRYRSLYQSMPDGFAAVDLKGTIIECNQSFMDMLGYEEHEIKKLSYEEITPKKWHDFERDILEREVFPLGYSSEYEKEYRKKDGSVFPVALRCVLTRDRHGDPSGAWALVRDITEQKTAGKKLAATQAFQEAIIDSTPDCIKVLDKEGRLLFMSQGAQRLFEIDEILPLLGTRYLDFWKDAPDEQLMAQILRDAMNGKGGSIEAPLPTAKGTPKTWSISVAPMRDEQGRVERLLVISRDVTEIRRATEALAKNEQLLNETGRMARVGGWELDLATNELYWSSIVREIHEVDENFRPTLEQGLDFYAPNHRERIEKALLRSAASGQSWSDEFQLDTAKGNRIWVRSQGRAYFKDGKPVRLAGSIQDITKRKKAELELLRLQRQDAAIAEMAKNMLTCDTVEESAQLVLDLAKRLTRSAFGYAGSIDTESGNLVPHTLSMDVWDKCRVADKDIIFQKPCGLWGWVLDQREPIMTNDPPADPRSTGTPEGHVPIQRFLSVPALIGDRLVGQIALANAEAPYEERDLEVIQRLANVFAHAIQRTRIASELIEAVKRAESANKAKTDFLAKMSHEIRTPMNAIINLSEATLESEPEGPRHDNLETVCDAAGHLLNIINDILDLSTIEAGKMEISVTDFDLGRELRSTIRTLRTQAENKGLSLHLDMAKGFTRVVRADPHRLRQIVVNLVGNAIKFTHKGSVTVNVECTDPSGCPISTCDPGPNEAPFELTFRVTDTGEGIPLNRQEAIFDSFTQADDSIRRRVGGSGLGLSICKQLVQRMGGKIGLESTPGQGACFFFTLPMLTGSKDAISQQPPIEPESLSLAPKHLDLLLAEDNEDNIKVVQLLLKRYGHRIVVARNGAEAVKQLARQDFDVVLMDLEMPGMDGLEATKRIRAGEAGEERSSVPIVAMTAHALAGVREQCQDAGMSGYVSKPIDINELRAALAQASLTESDPAGSSTSKTLDHRQALDLIDGNVELYEIIMTTFLERCDTMSDILREALTERDAETLARRAHSFKGISGQVGALRCQDVADSLEQAARANDLSLAAQLVEMLAEEIATVQQADWRSGLSEGGCT